MTPTRLTEIQQQLAKCQQERDEAVAHAMHMEIIVARNEQLKATLATLREALKTYGEHSIQCLAKMDSGWACDCGLSALTERAEG